MPDALETTPHLIVPEGVDAHEYVPTEYVGHPIPVNKYCRAWNGKRGREHYCKRIAGSGTTHKGQGRCMYHGGLQEGDARLTNGSRVRYSGIKHPTLADLIEKFAADPDPTNVFGELAMARALLVEFIERHGDFTEALLDWHSSFKLAKHPIDEELATSFERIVDEWAIHLAESGADASDMQIADVTRAKRFIQAYRKPIDEGRPRRVTDILDAQRILETIAKLVDRLDKRDTISEPELMRIVTVMGRVVDVIIPPGVIAPELTGEYIKAKIREGWMRAVTR